MLTIIQKRFILFLIGCIGTRTFLAYMAKTYSSYLPMMGYLAIIPAIGFIYIYATGSRQTGPEVFGDYIWWNDLRPIHAMLYIAFAYTAISRYSHAWMFLAADVMLGLISFLIHHYKNV